MSQRLKFVSQKYAPQEKFSFELDAQQGYAEKSKNGTICGVWYILKISKSGLLNLGTI